MAKKEPKVYTAQDFNNNIEKMLEEKLPLDAPVEVTVEGDDNVYEIESLGHFHAIANMTIALKLKNYVPKNGDYAMTLHSFLDLYNFREMVGEKEDTQIIRIYLDFPSKYIEIGVNDWSYSNYKTEIIEQTITKKLLNRNVRSFNYDNDRDIFCVYLTEIGD